jgi:flavin reductase (DIM6/NTAB) family NADH-FMN oxidoreductase RutF
MVDQRGGRMKKSIGAKTILFPTPVLIIGTYDKSGKPNAMAVAWGGICCSDPPCVAIALREATYTYGNIMERKAFTVSIPSEKYIKEADYFGIVSGRNEDKFSAMKLTPVKSVIVDAPYVEEFPFILECTLLQSVKIGLHTQFIGQIKDVKAEEAVLAKEGFPDIGKIKPFIFNPANRTYYGVGKYLGDAFSIGKKKKE